MAKKDLMEKYAKQRNTEKAVPIASFPIRETSVTIKRAENGFIVSKWEPGTNMKPGRDRLIICKTLDEAKGQATRLMKL